MKQLTEKQSTPVLNESRLRTRLQEFSNGSSVLKRYLCFFPSSVNRNIETNSCQATIFFLQIKKEIISCQPTTVCSHTDESENTHASFSGWKKKRDGVTEQPVYNGSQCECDSAHQQVEDLPALLPVTSTHLTASGSLCFLSFTAH